MTITFFAATFTAQVHISKMCSSYLSFSIERPDLADTWYSLSYLYFCPVAMLVTMSTGLIVSAISGLKLLVLILIVTWGLNGQ